MWTNVILVIGALMLLSASFLIGFFVGLSNALDMVEFEENEDDRRLYCFQCEIEMPVKEKDGRFYCSSCGLYHGSPL